MSGVLLFVVVSAYLGLVRAAYEEKCEYFAGLATNMLRSSQRALETIQKTDEYVCLHVYMRINIFICDIEHPKTIYSDSS